MAKSDPVKEAVVRAALGYKRSLFSWPEATHEDGILIALEDALAPYGGLVAAIAKLEEINQTASDLKRLKPQYAAEGIGPDGPD